MSKWGTCAVCGSTDERADTPCTNDVCPSHEGGDGTTTLRTTSDSDPGGNAESEPLGFVEALTQFSEIMADLKRVGNPALAALLEKHPDDEDEDVFTPQFKAKCRALLAARDFYGMLDAMTKQAKIDKDELELEVYEIFDNMNGDDNAKVKGTVPVPLGPPYGTVKFKARETYYSRIIDDEALQEYLEQRALVDSHVAPKFDKSKLNTMVREIVEDPNGKLPPGLTYTVDRGMTITREK